MRKKLENKLKSLVLGIVIGLDETSNPQVRNGELENEDYILKYQLIVEKIYK